jgi:hypothetical protein
VIENGTKHIFYQNIKERVNIDYTLKPTLLPTLPVAMHIDFIGQNGTVIIGKTIDFEKRFYDLRKEIADIYTLRLSFDDDDRPNTFFFLIGNEPPTSKIEHHNLWDTLKSVKKWIKIVPSTETKVIEKQLIEKDVRPFDREKM